MIANECTPESHAELLADPAQWDALALVGRVHVEADPLGPALTLECRNCTCGGTLSRLVTS